MKKNFILQVLLLIITGTLSLSDPYTITPITDKPGIFYQNLGNVKIYNSFLSLLSFTNLSFYQEKFTFIKDLYPKSIEICKKCENFNGQAYSCNRSLRFIELQIIQLNKKLETIAHLTEHTVHTSRQRRGLFNGISTGLKWLIGAPDANDAEFYSVAIKTLQNKNRETLTLMRQQIHIMNSAIISYNNSVQSFKEIETKLNANIKTFNNFTKSVTKKSKSTNNCRTCYKPHRFIITPSLRIK
jgi:hypothetical protein